MQAGLQTFKTVQEQYLLQKGWVYYMPNNFGQQLVFALLKLEAINRKLMASSLFKGINAEHIVVVSTRLVIII